ncbi:MAG TPA: prepilin-type N-terminal cleavage/methylation domain-containing protein [Armatimonadota bacterium]|jgi:prepilin-type N-terminal cleavage/methylation domain-containing protein/prepilin-type processing-associated H-X9-DG protein
MQRRGFTLIELLVVIAIIAILAAILFPVFARARAKAQQSNCLSNAKQLVLGMLMYASDADDRFPSSGAGVVGCSNGADWAGQIYPYVKNAQIYICPSAFGTSATTCPTQGVNTLDYAMNGFLNRIVSATPTTQSSVSQPANCLLLTEGDRGRNAFDWSAGDINYANTHPGWYLSNPDCLHRHNDGSNYGFCDGHSKWMKMPTTGTTPTVGIDGAAGTFGAWYDYRS